MKIRTPRRSDEMHAIHGRAIYDVMKQSQTARRQPLMLEITTNGFERESIFDDQHALAVDVIEGRTPEPVDDFLALLYELDSRDEWQDERMWIKANPGLGTIKSLETMRKNIVKAKRGWATQRLPNFSLSGKNASTEFQFG